MDSAPDWPLSKSDDATFFARIFKELRALFLLATMYSIVTFFFILDSDYNFLNVPFSITILHVLFFYICLRNFSASFYKSAAFAPLILLHKKTLQFFAYDRFEPLDQIQLLNRNAYRLLSLFISYFVPILIHNFETTKRIYYWIFSLFLSAIPPLTVSPTLFPAIITILGLFRTYIGSNPTINKNTFRKSAGRVPSEKFVFLRNVIRYVLFYTSHVLIIFVCFRFYHEFLSDREIGLIGEIRLKQYSPFCTTNLVSIRACVKEFFNLHFIIGNDTNPGIFFSLLFNLVNLFNTPLMLGGVNGMNRDYAWFYLIIAFASFFGHFVAGGHEEETFDDEFGGVANLFDTYFFLAMGIMYCSARSYRVATLVLAACVSSYCFLYLF